MSNWDIDYYKTDYESEEHWNLRKRFMEFHKEKFSEDELVCLAQVFTNVEFMGCKYPEETMQLVAHLSTEVAEDFRKNRASRLKRTFVQASDAAEARAKGRRTNAIDNNSNTKQKLPQLGQPKIFDLNNKRARFESHFFTGLRFGQFVLFLTKDRNCITNSGQLCSSIVDTKESIQNDGIKCEIFLDGNLIASASGPQKETKATCFNAAIDLLKRECYTIMINPNCEKIIITKRDNAVVTETSLNSQKNKLDITNIGYKMMQKQGWNGGGLGSKTQGLANPIECFLNANNRRGLGSNVSNLDTSYFQDMIQNYTKSDEIRDLRFENTFSKDERASLHEIAKRIGLKSTSYGKDDARYLIISKKKVQAVKILEEVLVHRSPAYTDKYVVQVPECKSGLYPEHTQVDFGDGKGKLV